MMVLLTFLALVSFANISYGESVKNIVDFLASEKLEGRKPGQRGNELATKYLEQQLRKANLKPLGKSYLQEFTIFTEMSKLGRNSFSLGKTSEKKFQPITYSLNGTLLDKEIVFVGFGISIPSGDPILTYDDYAGIDVKGKIVIAMTGDPGIGNTNSHFRKPEYQNYRSLFYKLKNAISHGAEGILLINNPMSIENYPSEGDIFFNNTEGGGSRFSILAGKISNQFVDSKLSSGISTLDIQKAIVKTQKPKSFAISGKANLEINLKKHTGRVSNIVGVKEGTDPVLKKEVIVLGAHMDHLGFGGESSLDPQGEGKIHNGADDNASGTAHILRLASKLENINLKRTIVFALFNAEEMGLLGSQFFVDMWARYESDYGPIKAMINYDMIGRYEDQMSVMGIGSSSDWKKIFTNLNQTDLNLNIKNSLVGSSDHAPFVRKKIPSLFFTTGAHEDYHRSSDTAEKINVTAMEKLENVSLSMLKTMENFNLVFDENFDTEGPSDRNRGYGAHLGCVPEFGQSDQIVGVICMRASENSPAEGAGIVAGDILVQIGTIDIKNIYDLAFALKYYRAGDEVEIAWKRGSALFKLQVKLAKSKR